MSPTTAPATTRLFLAVLGLATPMALAQNAQPVERVDLLTQAAPMVYENQMVVSVRINSIKQLDAALGLAESSWSERPGLGQVTLQIKNSNLNALKTLGVNPIVQIPDLQAHNQQNWADLVNQERLDIANKAGAHRPLDQQHPQGTSTHDENWFTGYKQLTDIYAYMDTQVAAHPDLVTKADIGDTIQARDIFSFTITAPDEAGNLAADRPVILWNGCQHAREWVSPMTVTYIASKLIDDADSDPEVAALLSSVRFVIIPVVNPDGYLYTWSTERYWRKNRRNNGGSFGVDLNRNWDSVEFAGDGTSSDPSSDVYHGGSPFSEPETTAVSNLANGYGSDLASHIDYHTFSQLILWPLGYASNLVTPEPDRTNFINLSGDMSSLIQSVSGEFYDPIQSWLLYPAAGTCSDWFYDDRGVTSFTVELRPADGGFDGFSPPPSIILPTAQENWEAAKLFAVRTTQAMSLSHEPLLVVQADTPEPVSLTATPGISEVDPATVFVHSRIGSVGAFDAVAMVDSGSSTFTGHLPGAACDQSIEYYFTADSLSGVSFTFPINGQSSPLSALSQEITIAFEDDMESITGWTVGQPSDSASTGVWERANPQATAAQPEDDHTQGTGTICWITDGDAGGSLGANDIDGGATTLTSPSMDASSAGEGAELVYWRWYSNNTGASPNEDSMLVQISDDNGGSWSTLETVTENANAWVEKRFPAPASSQVMVRFVASDLGSGSIVEAGVDDLRIEAVGCSGNPADINGDGVLDFFDVSEFLALFGAQDPQADFTGDGVWDFFDVSAFLAAFSAG